jgi:GT2 family glycosyltransferase
VWRGRQVPEAPVVSVCIPVVSGHGLIAGCLDSIAASHPSVETEVIVVANGLGRDDLISLRGRDDIVLAYSAVNAGFSGGNNLAAGYARGRYLLLLNDDSAIEPGFIDCLLGAVRREPSIAAAGGMIVSVDGMLQEAGSVLWRDGWVAHVGAGQSPRATPYRYVRDVDYISANGLLVDRRAWDAVGGLDERYFPAYYEDVDLCLALRQQGYRVVYEPRARLRHLESQSTSTTFRNFLLIRNRAQLVAKWSAVLEEFAEHPEPIDETAIDAAVLRARRSKGRILLLEDSPDPRHWHVALLEALIAAGWSVMLSVPGGGRVPGDADDGVLRERMLDLGVDVRGGDPGALLFAYRESLDAIVASRDRAVTDVSLRRPDGSPVPLVRQGSDDPEAEVSRVNAVTPMSAGRADERVDEFASDRPLVETGSGDISPRTLDFTEADAVVHREYVTFLEEEVAHLRDVARETDAAFDALAEAFDEKERYIDSLLSVRAKKWIIGRIPGHGS